MYRMLLVTIMLANVAPAVHAMPTNDDFRRRTIVNAPGFVDNVNTQAATTEPGDPDCAGRGPTVWYAFTPSVDMRVEVNTFGSDYDTTLSVHVGRSSALVQVACNDDTDSLQSRVRFDVVANVTYYLMVEQPKKVRARNANCEVSDLASNFSTLHRPTRHDRERFSPLARPCDVTCKDGPSPPPSPFHRFRPISVNTHGVRFKTDSSPESAHPFSRARQQAG